MEKLFLGSLIITTILIVIAAVNIAKDMLRERKNKKASKRRASRKNHGSGI